MRREVCSFVTDCHRNMPLKLDLFSFFSEYKESDEIYVMQYLTTSSFISFSILYSLVYNFLVPLYFVCEAMVIKRCVWFPPTSYKQVKSTGQLYIQNWPVFMGIIDYWPYITADGTRRHAFSVGKNIYFWFETKFRVKQILLDSKQNKQKGKVTWLAAQPKLKYRN